SAGGLEWRGDAETERREVALNQRDKEIGLREGFGAQSGDPARFGDEFERAQERREGENVWRANVQRGGAGGRLVEARHRETALGGNSPPAREPGGKAEMAAVQVKTAGSAGTGIKP